MRAINCVDDLYYMSIEDENYDRLFNDYVFNGFNVNIILGVHFALTNDYG